MSRKIPTVMWSDAGLDTQCKTPAKAKTILAPFRINLQPLPLLNRAEPGIGYGIFHGEVVSPCIAILNSAATRSRASRAITCAGNGNYAYFENGLEYQRKIMKYIFYYYCYNPKACVLPYADPAHWLCQQYGAA